MKTKEVTSQQVAALAGKWHSRISGFIRNGWEFATITTTDMEELASICGSALTQAANRPKPKAKAKK